LTGHRETASVGWCSAAPHGATLVELPGSGGDLFANYDFNGPQIGADDADWPVGLVFTGNASVLKVKLALRAAFPWPGSVEYGIVQEDAPAPLADADRGQKSRLCSLIAPSVHYRLYAPPDGSFESPALGRYVIGTAHLDVGECGPSPVFGWSEVAEARVAEAAARLGWSVQPDAFDLGNAEPARWEGPPTGGFPGNHLWLADGRATRIVVP
jgi:hypothetical protein